MSEVLLARKRGTKHQFKYWITIVCYKFYVLVLFYISVSGPILSSSYLCVKLHPYSFVCQCYTAVVILLMCHHSPVKGSQMTLQPDQIKVDVFTFFSGSLYSYVTRLEDAVIRFGLKLIISTLRSKLDIHCATPAPYQFNIFFF